MKEGWGNRLWGLMAFFYEEFFERFPPYRRLIKEIIENLNGLPSSSPICLLDAGCGTGLLSVELARRGYFVLGIDRSSGMLKRARGKKQKENLDNLFFMEGDLNTGISLQKFSFQKILFIHSLYLLDDPAPTLEALGSVLRPGGEIIMCNPSRKLTFGELWAGGWSFMAETIRERGILSIFFFFPILLSMGALNFVIQYRKERGYHCWDEKGIIELLKNWGFQVKWLRKSCLANSHLLLCAIKER
jgi:SAM-dependent methyltransferase